ncbi:hypothetical protein AB0I72_25515 [Nocardiopsis sp. NPDC049922]|uniref:hypothetical protein n=1 Tax=Nocardiopsis sp. NPDC049922 TaxID=3155157 RepID=UPI003404E7D6
MRTTVHGEPRPLVRWEHRVYSGELSELARVRADLDHDLTGAPAGLRPHVFTNH